MPRRRARLAAARQAACLSQERLADLIGVDRSTVVRWESGVTVPQPALRTRLAEHLGISLAELAELLLQTPTDIGDWTGTSLDSQQRSPLAGDNTDRRQALKVLGGSAIGVGAAFTELPDQCTDSAAEAMGSTRRAEATEIGPRTVEHLESVVADLASMFARTPPELLFPQVRWYRNKVAELIDAKHTLRQGRELYRYAGWFGIVLAWLANDLGDPRAAVAHCIDAWEHGWQAEDRDICAWAMDARATVALYGNRPAEARDAAQRGLEEARPGSAATVRVSAQLARAYARLGRADLFEDTLRETRHLLDRLDGQGSGLFSADAGRLASYAASSYIWLNEPGQAVPHAQEAISFYNAVPPPERSPTREAISHLDLALAYAEQRRPDSVMEHAIVALRTERLTGSVVSRLHDLTANMQRTFPDLQITRDLADQGRTLAASLRRPQLSSQ